MESPSTQSIIRQASQSMDDPNLMGSGSRRPGNVWSTEARDDLFRRRELGEGWETLCADYPDRSRHAMQQQYSMMKKQIAVANGTYNPKPRKRRSRKMQASKDTWASVNKKQLDLDEGALEEEEDDDEDLTMDESDDVDEEQSTFDQDSATFRGARPSIPLRSATDPVTRVQPSKIVKFPNLPKSAGFRPSQFMSNAPPEASKTSTDAEWSERETTSTVNPNKRRKLSPDDYNAKMKPMLPDAPEIFQPFPSIMLSHDQVAQIQAALQGGEETSRNTAMMYEAEKASLKKTSESMVARANRRAHDASEHYRETVREHAEDLKHNNLQHAEVVTALKKELDGVKKQREIDWALLEDEKRLRQNEQAERTATDDRHAGEIELLNDEIQVLQSHITAATLTADSEKAVTDPKHATLDAHEKLAQANQQISIKDEQLKNQSELIDTRGRALMDKDQLLRKQEEQIIISNQQRVGIGKEVQILQAKTTRINDCLVQVHAVHDKLMSSIKTFGELDLEDTGPKTLKKHVQAIIHATEDFGRSMDMAQESGEATSEFVLSLVQIWGNDVPKTNGANGHSGGEQSKD